MNYRDEFIEDFNHHTKGWTIYSIEKSDDDNFYCKVKLIKYGNEKSFYLSLSDFGISVHNVQEVKKKQLLYLDVEDMLYDMYNHFWDNISEFDFNCAIEPGKELNNNIFVAKDSAWDLTIGFSCAHCAKEWHISLSNIRKSGGKWTNMFLTFDGRETITRRCGPIGIYHADFIKGYERILNNGQ